jgi:hypothetical protein
MCLRSNGTIVDVRSLEHVTAADDAAAFLDSHSMNLGREARGTNEERGDDVGAFIKGHVPPPRAGACTQQTPRA